MSVITISRQFASGGSPIAERVAKHLDWIVIDNDFVDRVAERTGLPQEEIARREERVPGLVDRLAATLAISAPELFLDASGPAVTPLPEEHIVRMTEAVISEAAAEGSVVIVGRGAPACLAQHPHALHVRIVAPRAHRITAACERLGLDASTAEHKVDEIDRARRAYVHQYYQRDWDEPTNYDLVINTGRVSWDDAARLIAQTQVP